MNEDSGQTTEDLKQLLDHQPSVIVIGYGNPLRGDDAVGYQVAQKLANWKLKHVSVLAVHQLTPELAATVVKYDEVIFVDAAHEKKMSLRLIMPKGIVEANTHTCSPQGLLALANTLYERSPRGWWLTIPTMQYDLGTPLSVLAQEGMEDALQMMHSLFNTVQGACDARNRDVSRSA